MVERRVGKGFSKHPRRRENMFVKGHKKRAGRKPGSKNRIPRSLKEAIMTAVELCGYDKKGKDGAVGYLRKIAETEPGIMCRMLEKLMPLQVTGEAGGPVKVMALPPEVLSSLPEDELRVMEVVYTRIQAGLPATIQGQIAGDADAYAHSLNGGSKPH